ncbi:MAG TPA: hypothetical protein PLB62_05670 [Candidatus Sumerlaeota bacterium]|nr:hypothetical protein [Candidatus Sumerlaeota bacterium]
MKGRLAIMASAIWAALTLAAPAIQTGGVELGTEGVYDGQVAITRDGSGRMLFSDATLTTPVTLATLAHGIRSHGELAGLGGDDHGQYLDAGRHEGAHGAAFNDSLTVSPDVMGHTRLGQHLQDASCHLSASLAENIVAGWKFYVMPEFRANIRMSSGGGAGKSTIYFEAGEVDAQIAWQHASGRFETNRTLYAPAMESGAGVFSEARVTGALKGNLGEGTPTGTISHFASIEGVPRGNLLNRSADEEIAGAWVFLFPLRAEDGLTVNGTLDVNGTMNASGLRVSGTPGVDAYVELEANGEIHRLTFVKGLLTDYSVEK